jgi:hypothetical protein
LSSCPLTPVTSISPDNCNQTMMTRSPSNNDQDLYPILRLQNLLPSTMPALQWAREFLKVEENTFGFNTHCYSWRCKFLQCWRCNLISSFAFVNTNTILSTIVMSYDRKMSFRSENISY